MHNKFGVTIQEGDRRKVHKHGSDMMPYVYCMLTRFLITRSDKHFYHFSNV